LKNKIPPNRRALFTLVASLLPVIAFAIVEEIYGTKVGLVAGVVLAIAELTYEWKTLGRPQGITIVANLLVLVLGGLSLYESNATFFKLQPAVLVFVFAGLLIGSSILKRPFLVELMKKQRPDLNEMGAELLRGLNLRLGIALLFAGLVGVYAAFYWPTAWWATYKAIGVPVFVILYMLLDVAVWKRRHRQILRHGQSVHQGSESA
jgi:intracellular septation protein